MSSPISYDLQGQGGGVVVSGGDSVTGNFRWIQVITDCVFSALQSDNVAQILLLQGPTIPAGIGIGGRFTEIELTSGVVIAYYA